MKNNKDVLISRLFEEAERYIKNGSEQQEIQKKLASLGYNQKRFLEGDGLLTECKRWQHRKGNLYGDKQEIASQLKAQEQEARQRFMDHVATVRYIFRNEPTTLAKFNVGRVSRNTSAWTLQADFFFSKIGEYAEALAAQGLSSEVLAQSAAMVQAVSDARNQRLICKGEAEEATRMRDVSVKALKAWMSDFRYMARLALKDSPQLLEVLGMVVTSKF